MTQAQIRHPPAGRHQCGCHLPPTAWGEHGWHWARFGDNDLERAIRRHLAEHGALSAQDEGRIREQLTKDLETYRGLPLAYAPCPRYRMAVREGQEREHARRTAGAGA
jgi:hypothetical protein